MRSYATERLRLRPWTPDDRAPFAALNADPRVMEHMPALLDARESDAMADAIEAAMGEQGFGFWAVERRDTPGFLGFVGLGRPRFDAHFTPCVEIGWRLAFEHWGHGFATEAAREALRVGFEELGLDEIVSFTSVGNTRSSRVMEKLGMRRDPAEDFDHPRVPDGHALRRHVLYRIGSRSGA